MRDATVVSELRAALRRRGVWGSRAERLLEEWTEHAREDVAQRMEQGATSAAAQEAAWNALGDPDVLAVNAGRELARASWLGRHPWLGGLVLPAFACLTAVAALLSLPAVILSQFLDVEALQHTHPVALLTGLRCWEYVFNWLPWLLSAAWLARIATRMPGGWKLFWITAMVLTVCSTSFWMLVQPPLHGPHTGSVRFVSIGVFGIIIDVLFHALGYGAGVGRWSTWVQLTAAHPGPWMQTAIMALGALAFYARSSGRYRWPATGAAMVALLLILAFVCGMPTFVL